MNRKSKWLDHLKKKQEHGGTQIQDIAASEKSREQKREIRRKILIGACYLHEAKKNNKLDNIAKRMDLYLTRDSDRALFCLKPLESEKTNDRPSE